MFRKFITLCLFIFPLVLSARDIVVVDADSRFPLPSASVYDSRGKAICTTDAGGLLPYIAPERFPITLRYLGYQDFTTAHFPRDTIFMHEAASELDEIVVESRKRPILHILGYLREYSMLTSYSDSVLLFREKMVDFMLTPDHKIKFDGWKMPRTLSSKSYYRFTNHNGLDSVSDRFNQHFSWSDWMALPEPASLPASLHAIQTGSDTLRGRYQPSVIWSKNPDNISVNVDVLNDSSQICWTPALRGFVRRGVEFDNISMRFRFFNNDSTVVSPIDLTDYNFKIESRGRGHDMFRFNSVDEPFFVETVGEIHILDREFISIKEAKKWADSKFDRNQIGIYKPTDVEPLPRHITDLIARVNSINTDQVRTDIVPDHNLISKNVGKGNFSLGHRVLNVLKTITGISAYKANKNNNRHWNDTKKKQIEKMRQRALNP